MAQPFKVREPAEAVRAEIQSDGGFLDAQIGVSTGPPPSSCGAGKWMSVAPVCSIQRLTAHVGSPLALSPWAMHGRDHLRDSFRYRSLASPKVRHMDAASVNRIPWVGLGRFRANSRDATRTSSAPVNSPGFWLNPGRQAVGRPSPVGQNRTRPGSRPHTNRPFRLTAFVGCSSEALDLQNAQACAWPGSTSLSSMGLPAT